MMEKLLEEATRQGILSTRAAAQMRGSVQKGSLSPEACEAALRQRLLSFNVDNASSSERRRQKRTAAAAATDSTALNIGVSGDGAFVREVDGVQSFSAKSGSDAVVRECVRMLCVELEQNLEAHDSPPASTGTRSPRIYTRQSGKASCQWGIACRQTNRRHWMSQDHPPEHVLLQTQTEMPTWSLESVAGCRHLQRSGHCFYQDRCRFAHLDFLTAEKATAPDSLWDHGASDAIPITHSRDRIGQRPPSRQRAPRASRGKACAVFRRFLMDTFGLEKLRSGGGVLDVAGGAGSLSFELLNLNDVPCVIVDPRRPCFRRASQVVTHRRRQWAASTDCSMLLRNDNRQTDLGAALKVPSWVEGWFGQQLWTKQLVDSSKSEATPEPEKQQLPQTVEDSQQTSESVVASNPQEARTDSGCVEGEGELVATRVDEGNIVSVLAHSSVVVGLHPDSATDAIVDFALQANKPFAIVPCCIFSKQEPQRRTASGGPIKTYSEYIQWLEGKHPGIKQAKLGFPGRNVVLYHLGAEAGAGA